MNERKFLMNEAVPLMQESLNRGQEVFFSPSGVSMLPTLKEGRDTVVLRAPSSHLRKYDIALFRRQNGQYVLHRVVKSRGGVYTFMGDAQHFREEGIDHSRIVALCVACVRNGRRISLLSHRHRLYARIRHARRAFYRAYQSAFRACRALCRKIFRHP